MTSTSYQSGDPSRPETTPSVQYFWDGVTFQNLRGRLRQVIDGAGSSTFRYDSMGRVSHYVRTTLGKTLTADYAWTQLGGIKTASCAETNPAGYTLIWDYDEQGRQVALRDSLGTPLVGSRELIHDPDDGFFEEFAYPNGIVERIDYNARLQPEHREARRSTGQYLMSLDYDFYGFANADNGNIWAVHDLVDPSRDRFYTLRRPQPADRSAGQSLGHRLRVRPLRQPLGFDWDSIHAQLRGRRNHGRSGDQPHPSAGNTTRRAICWTTAITISPGTPPDA